MNHTPHFEATAGSNPGLAMASLPVIGFRPETRLPGVCSFQPRSLSGWLRILRPSIYLYIYIYIYICMYIYIYIIVYVYVWYV